VNLRDTTRDIISQSKQPIHILVESVECHRRSVTADVHARDVEHRLRSLSGEYSALNVVAIMFAAFQQFAPGTDLGIDLAREYEMALGMKG
jgi:hypothetical protein